MKGVSAMEDIPAMSLSNIGQNLKYFRNLRNMTQREVADIAHISLSFYKSLESTSDSAPSLETLMGICMALEIPLDFIVKDCGIRLFSDYSNSLMLTKLQQFDEKEQESISKMILTLYEILHRQ